MKTPISGCRKVAFISRKGGVGKTTTCLLAGHTFALYRGDRIIAVDGNPDAGTLGHRVRRETTANLTSLLADADSIERYADIRGYTSQAPTRLEVVASDDDPRITQAIGEAEFQRAIRPPRTPLQPRLSRHGDRRPRIGDARDSQRGRPDRRGERAEPGRRACRELDARLARGERPRGPRPRCGRRSQRGSTFRGLRRPEPDRGALRQPVPRVRAHPLGSAPRSWRRSQHRPAPCTKRRRHSSSSPPASPPASPNQPKGGHAMLLQFSNLVIAATGIGGNPNPNGLPGSPALEKLISGVAFWALLAALGGLLISSAVWALSSHSGNYHHTSMGRRGTVDLRRRRVPRRRRARDHRVLRGPRTNGQVAVPGRDCHHPVSRPLTIAGPRRILRLGRGGAGAARASASRSVLASPRRGSTPRSAETTSVAASSDRHHARADATSAPTARTRAGAVAAAALSITAFDGDVLLHPERLRAVVSAHRVDVVARALIEAFEPGERSDAREARSRHGPAAGDRASLGSDRLPSRAVLDTRGHGRGLVRRHRRKRRDSRAAAVVADAGRLPRVGATAPGRSARSRARPAPLLRSRRRKPPNHPETCSPPFRASRSSSVLSLERAPLLRWLSAALTLSSARSSSPGRSPRPHALSVGPIPDPASCRSPETSAMRSRAR